MKSWRLCAEHYPKQWSDQDSEFHASFSGNDVACELLGEMCWKYQVARTVPGRGTARYKHFAEMLSKYREQVIRPQEVADIIETGANDVYIVNGPRGEILIPAIKDVLKRIDPHAGRMLVQPLPGMLPEPKKP